MNNTVLLTILAVCLRLVSTSHALEKIMTLLIFKVRNGALLVTLLITIDLFSVPLVDGLRSELLWPQVDPFP